MQGKPLCPRAPPPSASSLKPQTSKAESCVPEGLGALLQTITMGEMGLLTPVYRQGARAQRG